MAKKGNLEIGSLIHAFLTLIISILLKFRKIPITLTLNLNSLVSMMPKSAGLSLMGMGTPEKVEIRRTY